MAGLLRVAFVNTSSDTPVTIHVWTQDAVECCELLATTPVTQPEQNPGTRYAPGEWDLVIPAGKMFGFVTEQPVKFTNPNSASVVPIHADGKDPWPQPPPSMAGPAIPDFATRYKNFLMTAGLPNPRPEPIVVTLAPAHMVQGIARQAARHPAATTRATGARDEPEQIPTRESSSEVDPVYVDVAGQARNAPR